MKLKIFLPLGILLIPGLWYLLTPLSSNHFKIQPQFDLLKAKEDYLNLAPALVDKNQPNIIWIIADDLGYYDTDLYSKNGKVEVPNIRRLSDEGVLFTEGFVTSPVCSPSRAAILTGRYNQRFGFEHQLHDRYLKNRIEYYGFKYLVNNPVWKPIPRDSVPNQAFMDHIGLPLSEITIAEVLKKKGYKTGLMGKWHVSKSNKQSPAAFGFDEFYGFYSSHSLYSKEGSKGIVDVKNPEDWTDDYIWEGQREGLHAIQRNDKVINENRYLTTAIADESIAFLEKNGTEPFFLMAAFNAPHAPFQVPQSYYDQYAEEEDPVKRTYYGMIKCLDDEIGRLLDFVEQSGLAENTALFFISDNGGAAYTFATDNAPLKGGKITNFDGGVKVPFILKAAWLDEGTRYDFPVSSTDLFVTTAALVGQDLPDREYDGVNLLENIKNGSAAHDHLYYRKGFNHTIRTPEYKMIWNTELEIDTLLYRIDKDPGEKHNLFYSQRELADSLLKTYHEWEKGLRPAGWPSVVFFNFEDENGDVFVFEN